MSIDQNGELPDPDAPTLPRMSAVSDGTEPNAPLIWPNSYSYARSRLHPEADIKAWYRRAFMAGSLACTLLVSCLGAGFIASRASTSRPARNTSSAALIAKPTKVPATPTPTATPIELPTATPTLAPTPTSVPTPPPVPTHYSEVQEFGAHEWANPVNATGEGAYIAPGQAVPAVCIWIANQITIPSVGYTWYRLPDGMYVPTNTFWNQANPNPPDAGNRYDPNVPICSDSPSQVLPPIHA